MKTFTSLVLSASLFVSVAHAQYCMLPGRTPYSDLQPGITNFKLNTINRTSSNVESFGAVVVETGDTTILVRGHTYTVQITHTRDSVLFDTVRNNIRVWIDYNQNTSFDDAGETVISSDYQHHGVYTNTFTVPTTASVGITRLRATAKMSSDGGHILPSSCDVPMDPIGYHGEMEDYVVKILATTAIENINEHNNNAVVYPNPTANNITIAFDAVKNDPVSISLFDITGKMIGRMLNDKPQSSLSYSFDLDNYVSSPGIYFIKIDSDGSSLYQKIIKN